MEKENIRKKVFNKNKKGVKMLIAGFINMYIALIMFFSVPSCNQLPAGNSSVGTSNQYVISKAYRLQTAIVKLPDGYESSKSYPVLVVLHGNGGNADEVSSGFNAFSSLPVIIVAPQGQYAKYTGGFSWYMDTTDKDLWELGDLLISNSIIESINEVKKKYKTGDVYIFGFSQGASVAYMTGIKYPSGIKGVAAVGGGMPEIDVKGSVINSADVDKAKNVKMFIARGVNDPLTGMNEYSNQIVFFTSKGYNVTDYEYEGGHTITNDLLNKLFQWMGMK